jgi:hypothetical protein
MTASAKTPATPEASLDAVEEFLEDEVLDPEVEARLGEILVGLRKKSVVGFSATSRFLDKLDPAKHEIITNSKGEVIAVRERP